MTTEARLRIVVMAWNESGVWPQIDDWSFQMNEYGSWEEARNIAQGIIDENDPEDGVRCYLFNITTGNVISVP